MSEEKKKTGVIIPPEKLSKMALQGLVDEFILREGTDYGHRDVDIEEKRQSVFNQLRQKHIFILFDQELESTTLIRKDDLNKVTTHLAFL